jgi:hypothetical protein
MKISTIFAGMLALFMAAQASAGEASGYFPDQFLISRGPPGSGLDAPIAPAQSAPAVEKAQALNGLNYTVVSPIYLGANNNTSYVRFFNENSFTSITSVTLVGNASGTIYGVTNVTVPSGASPQYSIYDLAAAAGAGPPFGADVTYSLYLRNGDTNSGFQHVIYNSFSGFFENVSICTYLPGYNYSNLNQAAMNVHTTSIPNYPSLVLIHNYLNFSVTMNLDVYDARTGAFRGRFSGTAAANGGYAMPMSYIQQQIGWSPGPTDYHANILVTSPDTTGFYALVGQNIFNSQLSTYINMSQICYINH